MKEFVFHFEFLSLCLFLLLTISYDCFMQGPIQTKGWDTHWTEEQAIALLRKRERDLRPNETSRFEANFNSRHFDKARPWQSNREIIRVQINQVLPTQKYSLQRFVEFDTSYCFICFRLCFVFTYKTTVGIFTKSCVSLFTLP